MVLSIIGITWNPGLHSVHYGINPSPPHAHTHTHTHTHTTPSKTPSPLFFANPPLKSGNCPNPPFLSDSPYILVFGEPPRPKNHIFQ